VRKAGCRALTELTIRLSETSRYNQQLVEALFPRLDDPEQGVVEEALEALRTVCYENLAPEDVLPVLPELMQKLQGLLREGVPMSVQQYVVRVLGAVATSAEEHYVPYLESVVVRLLTVVQAQVQPADPGQVIFKVHALEVLGLVATAVGASAFGPYLKKTMAVAVLQVMNARAEDWELRECTWALFSNLAITFGEAFAVFLPGVVPMLFESALSNAGVTSKQAGTEGIQGDAGDLDARNYQVRESFVDEKEGAVQTLGLLAEHTGTHYLPFVEHTCATLQRLVRYFAPSVRAGVLTAYPRVISAVVQAYPPAAPWRRGSLGEPPAADVAKLADGMLKEALAAALDDHSKLVCAQGLQTVATLAKQLGPCVLAPLVAPLHTCCQRVLAGQVSCQRGTDCFDDEDEEVENLEVFDGLTELLIAVAAVFGDSEHGIALLKPVLPQLLTYCREEASLGYRQHAVGSLGDIAVQLGAAFLPYVLPLWPMVLHSTSSPSSVMRRNGIYTAGCLASIARKPELSVDLLKCALELREDDDDSVRDNMAGSVARAICAVDLSQPLPADRFPLSDALRLLLSVLPLTEDREPIEQVLPCLVLLCKHQFDAVAPYLDRVLDNFLHELAQRIKHIQAGQSDTDPNIVQAPVAQGR
jgi:importin-4